MVTKYMKLDEAIKAVMKLAQDNGYAYIGQTHTDPSSPWAVGDTREEVELACHYWNGDIIRVMIDNFPNRQVPRLKPHTLQHD